MWNILLSYSVPEVAKTLRDDKLLIVLFTLVPHPTPFLPPPQPLPLSSMIESWWYSIRPIYSLITVECNTSRWTKYGPVHATTSPGEFIFRTCGAPNSLPNKGHGRGTFAVMSRFNQIICDWEAMMTVAIETNNTAVHILTCASLLMTF